MKKLLLITCLILAFMQMKSQGNLQFNQVLNFGIGTSYTVPPGKVLKIESINFNSPVVTSNYSYCYVYSGTMMNCFYETINYLVIDQNTYSVGGTGQIVNEGVASCTVCPPVKQYGTSPINFTFPIWLSSGKNLNVLASGIFVSAIEFNITP